MMCAPLPINNQNCSNAAKSQTAVSTLECQAVNHFFLLSADNKTNLNKHNIMLSALLRVGCSLICHIKMGFKTFDFKLENSIV